VPRLVAQDRHRLLRLHRASGYLGTSRGSSRGSSSTPSTTPPVQVPRHVAWLVAPLVVDYSTSRRLAVDYFASRRLAVDYFASRRLVVDYFAYATRLGPSAHSAARHAARSRLLRLRRASGCFGTSRGSSSTTSLAARPGASARRVARRVARRRLLRLRHASGCFGTSRGSSRRSSSTTSPRAGSSSTTSPTPRVRVPRHVARLVTRLVVDYSVRRDFVLRTHWLYFGHAVRRDYLSRGNTGSTSTTPHAAATSSFGRIASTIHLKTSREWQSRPQQLVGINSD
jgi:hypothetical protein